MFNFFGSCPGGYWYYSWKVASGNDIAAKTAGIILVNSNPKDILSLIIFGKATYRKMIQNLVWATG